MIEGPSRAERLRSRSARTTWGWAGWGWAGWGWDRLDVAGIGLVLFVACAIHPIHQVLTRPYWVDEAWVAVLAKAPLGRLVHLSSSSPAGFVALLRFVPGTGLQRARLAVLAFSALTAAMAYALTRSLAWRSRRGARAAALVAALVVMFVPLSLIRNDLKQYTCDGFFALLVLAVGAWADRSDRRSRLWWLALTAIVATPFSSTSAFVSVAVFVGLLVSALAARSRRRVFDVVMVGGVAAIGLAAYFGAAVTPNLDSRLHAYWSGWYLSGSLQHMLYLTWRRISRVSPDLAMPAVVFIAFFALGIAVLVKLRARALAVAMPFLWFEMAIVGRLRRYPFLDLRTSQFLLVSSFAVVAIGAVGLLGAIARLRAVMSSFPSRSAAVVVGGVLAGLFAVGVVPRVGDLHIPTEDVRAGTLAVAAHYRPGDVIVVSGSANFGFAYYWPHGHVSFHKTTSAQGFRTEVRGIHAIYARGRSYADVLSALRAGAQRRHDSGRGSVLYVVRVHMPPGEIQAWNHALAVLHLRARNAFVGSDPVLVVGSS